MWRGSGWAALALPAMLWLAGCTGGSGPKDAAGPGSTLVVPGDAVPGAAILRGMVVDEEHVGVDGAVVGILELKTQTTTDGHGVFAFANVPPGKYRVQATAVGYTSDLQLVALDPDADVRVVLQIARVRYEEPFHAVMGPFNGFFECRYGVTYVAGAWASNCGTVCILACVGPPVNPWPNNKNSFTFNMTQGNWRTFVGEMRWQQATLATSDQLGLVFSYQGRPASHWWCFGSSGSPMTWRFEKDPEGKIECKGGSQGGTSNPTEPTTNHTLLVFASVPFGTLTQPVKLSLQQRFEVYVTAFYGQPADAEYSAFPDA